MSLIVVLHYVIRNFLSFFKLHRATPSFFLLFFFLCIVWPLLFVLLLIGFILLFVFIQAAVSFDFSKEIYGVGSCYAITRRFSFRLFCVSYCSALLTEGKQSNNLCVRQNTKKRKKKRNKRRSLHPPACFLSSSDRSYLEPNPLSN